ncbi:MAG: PEP-CTERM sorting domain-containing protein [Acidobacteria bacterium]|nr:PEP-CTERM sorting domain-containing protein [Acidobacteriota bacterium]
MRKLMLFTIVAASSALAGSWDVAADFNASNNPGASSVFSYGWGATPAAFAAMSVVTQNCFAASPTECLNNGASFPGTSSMEWNGTAGTLTSGTVNVFPGFVTMDPQSSGGTILRFTAPTAGLYSMTGIFKGADSGQSATTGSVYHNGTSLQSVNVNTFLTGPTIGFSNLSLNAGDTIDFIVASNSGCCYLSTALGATITSQSGGSGVPEPGTLLLIPAALPLILRRRRHA